MLIVTTNEIPGYQIEAVLGEVMGLTVRSANIGANLVASLRSLGGGEINEYSQLVYESRAQVMDRMWQQAVQRGANAVVCMRFDTGDIAQSFSEVCAYGTAVVVHPIPEGEPGSTPQSAHDARTRQQAAQRPPGQPVQGQPVQGQPFQGQPPQEQSPPSH